MLSAAVVPKTDCSSTHVLCLCGGLGSSLQLRLLSSFGLFLSNILRGLSQLRLLCLSILQLPSLQSPWLLQRPGTVELFAAPPVVSVLLLSSDFLTVCALCFNSAAFCSSMAFLTIFCIGVTSHRRDSLDAVSALTWFSHSSYPSPSNSRPSWTCTCTRRGPLNLERVVECSSLGFRALLKPRISCLRSCKSRSSSSRPRCEHHCLAAGASGILSRLYHLLSFVVCLDCFLRCNFHRCPALASDFSGSWLVNLRVEYHCLFASSSSRYFAVSWTLLSF